MSKNYKIEKKRIKLSNGKTISGYEVKVKVSPKEVVAWKTISYREAVKFAKMMEYKPKRKR